MDYERRVVIDTPDLSNIEESFSGPNGDYYWHLMHRVHRSERRVVEEDICQYSSKGGYTVELKPSEAGSGEDKRQAESLIAVSKLLDMPIEDGLLVGDLGKMQVCHARNRNWHLSTPIKNRDKADALILTWPMNHNSLAYDVMGWCTLATFKQKGFAPKLADPPVWMIQWYHLKRMNTLGVEKLHYDDSLIETNRRLLESIDHKPFGIDRMIDNIMRLRTPKKWKGQK